MKNLVLNCRIYYNFKLKIVNGKWKMENFGTKLSNLQKIIINFKLKNIPFKFARFYLIIHYPLSILHLSVNYFFSQFFAETGKAPCFQNCFIFSPMGKSICFFYIEWFCVSKIFAIKNADIFSHF